MRGIGLRGTGIIPATMVGGNFEISYLLRDDFNDTLPAGSVNGTRATPGGDGTTAQNTRNVIDTENKISISSEKLVISDGKAAPGWGDPELYYGSFARQLGLTLIFQVQWDDLADNQRLLAGFVAGVTTPTSQQGHSFMAHVAYGRVYLYNLDGGVSIYQGLAPISVSTQVNLAISLRASGAYYLMQNGLSPYWKLLYWVNGPNTTPLYPGFYNNNGSISAEAIRIPVNPFTPTSLCYDTFNRADGVLGNTLSSGLDGQTISPLSWEETGTWAISGSTAVCSVLSGGKGLALVDVGNKNVCVRLNVTRNAGNVGMILKYADTDNYIRFFLDGTNLKMIQRVAGAETTIFDAARAPVANKPLYVKLDGINALLFYNDIFQDIIATVDQGLTGTKYGMYTTDTLNAFDDFAVIPTGTGGEHG